MFAIINPFDGEQLHPLEDRLSLKCFCAQNPKLAHMCPVHNPRDLVAAIERQQEDVAQEVERAEDAVRATKDEEHEEVLGNICDKLREAFGVAREGGALDEDVVLAMIERADTKVQDFHKELADRMQEALGGNLVVEADEQGLTQAVAQLAANAERCSGSLDKDVLAAATTCARLLNAVLAKQAAAS
ncbi:MAG: hypothetical protein KJ648_07300 [Candidatus Omnitrophica bacterium]|nr:hypothetical protein [Candidatus Omnitrophota bacterium]